MKAVGPIKGKTADTRPDDLRMKNNRNQVTRRKVAPASTKPRLEIVKGKMPIFKMPKGTSPLTPEMVKEIAP
jgi:hypothetical protein